MLVGDTLNQTSDSSNNGINVTSFKPCKKWIGGRNVGKSKSAPFVAPTLRFAHF